MQSEQLNELFAALAKAQAKMSAALKTSSNPFFKAKYADLLEIVEVSRIPLTDNNLSVMQPLRQDASGNDILVTILGHSSGQWISSTVTLKPQKQDAQSLGSYITYMRRYAYAALVGIVCDEDDDGERAMDRIKPEQAAQLRTALNGNKDLESKILTGLKVRKLEEISSSVFGAVIDRINTINVSQEQHES